METVTVETGFLISERAKEATRGCGAGELVNHENPGCPKGGRRNRIDAAGEDDRSASPQGKGVQEEARSVEST